MTNHKTERNGLSPDPIKAWLGHFYIAMERITSPFRAQAELAGNCMDLNAEPTFCPGTPARIERARDRSDPVTGRDG